LRDQGLSSKDRRGKVDAEAAAVILQDWLDRSEP
jgi:RNase H-fold protein (predicted Holliday junction resolvase)